MVTVAEKDAELQAVVALVDRLYASQIVESDLDSYEAILVGDLVAAQAGGAEAFRDAVAASIRASTRAFTPAILSYARHVAGSTARQVGPALDDIYDNWYSNSKHVRSRGVVFGSYSAAIVGTGVVNRVTKDWRGYNLEAITAEVKTATIVADARSGADPFEGVLEFVGAKRARSALAVAGSGIRKRLTCRSARQSLLANASFESYSGTAPTAGSPQTPTAVTDWTVTTIAATQLDADRYYKAYRSVASPLGLRFTGNNKISQALTVNGVSVKRFTPYHLEVAVYRESNCDGNLVLTLGSQSTTVAMSTLTNSAWNVVRLSTGADTKPWPLVWDTGSAVVSVELSSRTTGMLVLDDVLLVEHYALDGSFVCPVAGSTDYLLGDVHSSTDTITSDSKIQKHIALRYGRYLPHVPNASAVTASGGRTLTFVGGGTQTITASSGSFVSDGYVVGMKLTVTGTSSNNGTFTIISVSATVITVSSGLSNEGPLSATAALSGTANVPDPS